MSTTLTTLPDLATQINHEHAQAVDHAQKAIDCALQCGRLLIQAKGQLAHGEFLPWLKANCTVKQRQARAYMRIANNWATIEAKTAPGADLTIKGALALLEDKRPSHSESEPTDEIRQFVESLATDRVYRSVGENERRGPELFEITPSKTHPQCFWFSVSRDLDTDSAYVEYSNRPATRTGLGLLLTVHGFQGDEYWSEDPWSGEDPWYAVAPGKPALPIPKAGPAKTTRQVSNDAGITLIWQASVIGHLLKWGDDHGKHKDQFGWLHDLTSDEFDDLMGTFEQRPQLLETMAAMIERCSEHYDLPVPLWPDTLLAAIAWESGKTETADALAAEVRERLAAAGITDRPAPTDEEIDITLRDWGFVT